ncbi:ABC transporter permease [Leucobacter sp. CSA1]|uniref:ABC transporter permease n=1 Tax=Leucobacter chromiisoli TaxID=2796471 RepID=A0A934Q5R1_9MICO|nr:ABC transporter permease [Leucobacter chromiisoli]MBK0418890.1 ABC transporter permease [Leucobacter chromiisoli]
MSTTVIRLPLSKRDPIRVSAGRMRVYRGAVGVVVALLLLELVSRVGIIPSDLLPPVSRVLADTGGLLVNPGFLGDVGATIAAWALGLGIAILVAVPLGLILGSFRVAYEASSTVVEFLRPIPSVALIPLAILVFGQGTEMKVALAVYAAIWPVFFNTVYGVRDVDPVTKDTAKSFRLSPLGTLWHVGMRHAGPFIFTGIRISAAIALIVTISAELLAGSSSGIGAFILRTSSGGGDTALVFAGTIVAGLLGIIINWLLQLVERRMFAWKFVGEDQ